MNIRRSGPVMEIKVSEVAQLVGGVVQGNSSIAIHGVNGLLEAGPGELTFARSPRYFAELRESGASAALVPFPAPPDAPMTTICVEQPDVAFLIVLQRFASEVTHPVAGIHPTACISADARLGDSVAAGAHACVEPGAEIGDRVVLYPGVYVGARCRIGADTVLYPNVVLREDTEVGARCIVHAGACIGSDGFGFADFGGRWCKIPQIGKVIIGDDVEIGSNTTVDRATFGITRIGSGTKIDNLVQIGHNVQLGEHCAIAGKAGMAGSARIGSHVRIGADAGIAGHITIGDGATVGARAGVTRSVEANKIVSGFPAIDHALQRRVMVAQQKAPEMLRRLNELERKLQELKDASGNETTDNR